MTYSRDFILGTLDAACRVYPDRANGTVKLVVRHSNQSVLNQLKRMAGGWTRAGVWASTSQRAYQSLLNDWLNVTERDDIPPEAWDLVRHAPEAPPQAALFERLREWRYGRADGKPAYLVCSDRTLRDLIAVRPQTLREVHAVKGCGEVFMQRHAESVLQVLRNLPAESPSALADSPFGI